MQRFGLSVVRSSRIPSIGLSLPGYVAMIRAPMFTKRLAGNVMPNSVLTAPATAVALIPTPNPTPNAIVCSMFSTTPAMISLSTSTPSQSIKDHECRQVVAILLKRLINTREAQFAGSGFSFVPRCLHVEPQSGRRTLFRTTVDAVLSRPMPPRPFFAYAPCRTRISECKSIAPTVRHSA